MVANLNAVNSPTIGTVQSIQGQATAINSSGVQRALHAGDFVFADEIVKTDADSKLVIQFIDGSTVALSSEAAALLDSEVFDPESYESSDTAENTAENTTSIEAIQQAIAAGQDPTQIEELDPTAAGAGNNEQGGHSTVVLELTAGRTQPTSGFETTGLTQSFNQIDQELLDLDQNSPVISVSVDITVEDPDQQPPTDGVPTPEFPVVVNGNSASVLEGTSDGTKLVVFVISLNQALDTDIEVTYHLVPLDASYGEDWFDGGLVHTITIPAGETTFEVPINIVEDRKDEGNETFEIRLIEADGALIDPNASKSTITIFNDDSTPVANDDVGNIDDGSVSVSGNVLDNDTDLDGDADPGNGVLSVIGAPIVVFHEYGTLSIQADGAYQFSLNDEGKATLLALGDETVEITFSDIYQTTDGVNTSNLADLVINLNGLVEAPVAGNDAGNTDEDTPVLINVSGNDFDVDGAIVGWTLVSDASNGSVTNNNDGTFTYSPDANFHGSDSFTYYVTDDDGAISNTATVSVTIADVNDPPVAGNDAGNTDEDTPVLINVSGNDFDVDGTIVGWTLVSDASNGSVTNNNDGTFTYSPDANFHGSDSFTYYVTDDDGAISNTATVSVTIADVNDPPVAGNDAGNTDEDTPVLINVSGNDFDVDGTIVGWTLVSDASNGSVTNNNDGTFTYSPDANFHGSDSFTYYVTDDDGAISNTATVSVTIADVNDPPSGVLGDQENLDSDVVSVDISGAFSDADGDALTYSATGLPPGLSINPNTGVISGTIAASASDGTNDDNNTQDYNVTITVNDGTVDVDVPFTWTVNNTIPEFLSGSDTVDTVPNADSYSFSANEGTAQDAVIGTVTAADADGDTLTYSLTGGNESGLFAIDATTGAISVTQAIDDAQVGNYNLTVNVIDSEGGVDTADVAVDLLAVPVSSALLITNTNVEVQQLRVNVTSASGTNTTGVVEPTEVQGQEGSNLEFQDSLIFEANETYTVSIEHISGPTIILTDLSVSDTEGNILNIYEGNARLNSLDSGNNTDFDGYIFNVQIGANFATDPTNYTVDGAIGYEVDASGVLVLDTESNNAGFSLDFSELDLNEPDDLFGDVDELNISGKGTGEDNSVTLSAQDVLDLGADDGSDTSLTISGDVGDVLNLVDDDGPGGAGAWAETASGGGTITYTYSNGADIASVIVDDSITVNANI